MHFHRHISNGKNIASQSGANDQRQVHTCRWRQYRFRFCAPTSRCVIVFSIVLLLFFVFSSSITVLSLLPLSSGSGSPKYPPHFIEYWEDETRFFFSDVVASSSRVDDDADGGKTLSNAEPLAESIRQVLRLPNRRSIDVVDEGNTAVNVSQRVHRRLRKPDGVAHIGTVREKGWYRRGVLVFMVALPSQRVVYQRRSRHMRNFPLTYSILGEHHEPGTTYPQAGGSEGKESGAGGGSEMSHDRGGYDSMDDTQKATQISERAERSRQKPPSNGAMKLSSNDGIAWKPEGDVQCAYRGLREELGWSLDPTDDVALQMLLKTREAEEQHASSNQIQPQQKQQQHLHDRRLRWLQRRLFSGRREGLTKYDRLMSTDMLLLITDDELEQGLRSSALSPNGQDSHLVSENGTRTKGFSDVQMNGTGLQGGKVQWRVDQMEVDAIFSRNLSDMYNWLRYDNPSALVEWPLWTQYILEGLVSVCRLREKILHGTVLNGNAINQSLPHESKILDQCVRLLTECDQVIEDDDNFLRKLFKSADRRNYSTFRIYDVFF